jgi:hypothetical protein
MFPIYVSCSSPLGALLIFIVMICRPRLYNKKFRAGAGSPIVFYGRLMFNPVSLNPKGFLQGSVLLLQFFDPAGVSPNDGVPSL